MSDQNNEVTGAMFAIIMMVFMAIVLSGVITASTTRGNTITRLCGVLWDLEVYDRGCPIWWRTRFIVPEKEE